ncbi:protein FAM246C-like [Cyrtonyx montezumae]|uniref:protein FAM246C-like n=1 Tax=Cyrtonyx montezumae TaxID=9017 RepID=UPI0032DA7D1D
MEAERMPISYKTSRQRSPAGKVQDPVPSSGEERGERSRQTDGRSAGARALLHGEFRGRRALRAHREGEGAAGRGERDRFSPQRLPAQLRAGPARSPAVPSTTPKTGPSLTRGCGGASACVPAARPRSPGEEEEEEAARAAGRMAESTRPPPSPSSIPAAAQRCPGRTAPGGRRSPCPGPRRAGGRGRSREEEKRDENPDMMAAAAPSPPAGTRLPRPALALVPRRKGAGRPGGPRYLLPGDAREPPPTSANTKEN